MEDIEVINISLWDGEAHPLGQCPTDVPAVNTALQWLYLYGTSIFSISGNGADKSGISWPACVDGVVAVGSVTDAGLGTRNWGVCTETTTVADEVSCFSNSSDALDVLAPGAIILSTSADEDRIATQQGTSQAAPHAAAVAALLKQMLPGLPPDEVVNRMRLSGKWVIDQLNDSDPNTRRYTQRVDARVALVGLFPSQDYDHEGCTDVREFSSSVNQGGLRNPLDFWDYFDTPDQNNVRDRIIRISDTLRVIDRFNSNGNPNVDPLSPPPPTGYHPAFDRGGQFGPNTWNLAPPNGQIRVADIVAVNAQFNNDCI